MVNNSININKTNNHLKPLNTKKKTTTYSIGNPGPGLGQAQKCGGVKQIMSAKYRYLRRNQFNGHSEYKKQYKYIKKTNNTKS